MKAKEIRELSTNDIEQRLLEEEDELRRLRFEHAVASVENSALLTNKRRFVARLKTILRERELQEEAA